MFVKNQGLKYGRRSLIPGCREQVRTGGSSTGADPTSRGTMEGEYGHQRISQNISKGLSRMSRPTHTRRPASVQVPDHCEEDRHSAVYPCLPATARFLINMHTFLILMLLWEVSGQAPPAISLLLLLQVGTAVSQHPQPPCQPKVSGVVLLSQNTRLGKHTGLLHVSLTLHVSPMPHPTTLHTHTRHTCTQMAKPTPQMAAALRLKRLTLPRFQLPRRLIF